MDNTNEDTYDDNRVSGFLAGLLFIGGVIVGALAGAAAMLLTAPQSGKKTRKQLRRKGQDLRDQTAETIEDGVKQVRTMAHQVTTRLHKQAEELQQRGQDVLDHQKERWAPVVEASKTAVNGS
jgi:gas vesicle protein